MSLRPLGKVLSVVESLGLEVTYAYDDLVFVEHGAFVLQFLKEPGQLACFTNAECTREEAERDVLRLTSAFGESGLSLTAEGTCTLTPNADNTFSIQFE